MQVMTNYTAKYDNILEYNYYKYKVHNKDPQISLLAHEGHCAKMDQLTT